MGRETQRSSSFGFSSLGMGQHSCGWCSGGSVRQWAWTRCRGAALSPQSQRETSKMAKLNTLSVAFFIVGKGLLLESRGQMFVCLKNPEKEDVSGKREKKGNVSIWVHLYNIPFGAVVWLTSVDRAPSYRNLSSGSLAREPHETTTTLVLCGRFKQGIWSLE